jgi:hypothetical protein
VSWRRALRLLQNAWEKARSFRPCCSAGLGWLAGCRDGALCQMQCSGAANEFVADNPSVITHSFNQLPSHCTPQECCAPLLSCRALSQSCAHFCRCLCDVLDVGYMVVVCVKFIKARVVIHVTACLVRVLLAFSNTVF